MSLGAITDYLGVSSPSPPIYENLPKSVRSFSNKYSYAGDYAPLASIIPQLPEDVRNALVRADQKRVIKGQNVVAVEDTVAALSTILTGRPYTPPPKNPNLITDLPSAVFRDVRDIARSIPKMPAMLVQEARDLPKFATKYQEQLERTGNPIAALAASPGIRMFPGSFVVENVAGGTPSELLRRPVFTALDVAPVASRALRAARANPEIMARVNAVRGSDTYKTLATSNVALKAQEAFGRQARDTAYLGNTGIAKIGDWKDPTQRVNPELAIKDPKRWEEQTLAKETAEIVEKYEKTIPIERKAELTRAVQLDDLESVNPSDLERAYVGEYRENRQKWEDYALTRQDVNDAIQSVLDPVTGGTEIFPRKQASRIEAARTVARYHRDFADLRDVGKTGGTVTSILDRVEPYWGTDVIKDVGRRRAILSAAATAFEASGDWYRAGSMRKAITEAFNRKDMKKAMERVDAIRPIAGEVDDLIPLTKDALAARITEINDPRLRSVRTLIEGGAWASARSRINGFLNKQVNWTDEQRAALQTLHGEIGSMMKAEKALAATKTYTQKRAASLDRKAIQRFERTLPARYQPLVDDALKNQISGRLRELPNLPDEIRDQLLMEVSERNFTNLRDAGISVDEVRKLQRQISRTWTDMKTAGLDPVLVHRVHPDVAPSVNYAGIKAQITTPSQVKARAMDATPHYDNLSVALSHQSLEWLTRRGIEDFVDNILDPERGWARTHDELYNRYVPHARQLNSRRPDLDINSHVDKLMRREWTKFDPTARFPWMRGRSTGMPRDDIYVPKVVASTIDRFFNDNPGLFSQLSAPFMNGFRASVLTLSPRWHVYNILGGAVMMMARTNPITVWGQLDAARQMMRGEVPELLRGELGKARTVQQDLAFNRGIKFGEFMTRAKERSPIVNAVAETFNKVTDASWRGNQFVDDMYRTMSYLYGRDKALTKGMLEGDAIKAGVELSRKIMPDWNSMTPIERNVIRSVFPFYGFMSHILRYVYRYPIDHPVRVAVLGGFARAEMNDMEEATPTRFSELMAFGDEDDQGRRRALSFSGFNPFTGAADIFTMAGMLSQVNPILGTALEQVGVVRGSANLYPDVRYDPDTGRLALQSPNPIANLFSKTLPQVSFLTQMANPTSRLNQLRSQNPEVAESLIRGALGVPKLVVPYSEMDEQFKAELARREAANQEKAKALRTGIDVQARRSPQLAAYLQQLRALQSSNPDMFSAYAPATYSAELGIDQTQGVTAIGEAQRVLLGNLVRG